MSRPTDEQMKGADLYALVLSWNLGNAYSTERRKLNRREDTLDPSWGREASRMQRNMVEGVAAYRKGAVTDDR